MSHRTLLPTSFAALLAIGVGHACVGTETGNPQDGNVTVRMALTADDGAGQAALEGPDSAGRDFRITSARVYVRQIGFDLPSGVTCASLGMTPGSRSDGGLYCDSDPGDDSDELRLPGPWAVDLLTGQTTPPIGSLPIPTGTYRRVDVRLDDADPDDGVIAGGDPLADLTIVASGTADLEGTPTPFELALKFNEDARFEKPGGITVGTDPQEILLWLDVTGWFADLPLSECAADGDLPMSGGVLELNDGSGSCSDVENAIKDAIKDSGQLDRD